MFGGRKPSIRRSLASRTSWKRYVRHNLGIKAPRGWGWLSSPKKAAYNRSYGRSSVGWGGVFAGILGGILKSLIGSGKKRRRR